MKRVLKIFIFLISSLLIFSAAFLGIIYQQVSRDATTRIERGAIERIIFSESPVFYDDGQTPMGVYFEKTHSKYIHFRDIPKIYVKALIAAEDRNFFNHLGFDIRAILRALIANMKAGEIVQGGSTITQQTAKNIFKRQKKTYKAKFNELIQAMLLEKRYTKEEILEMYINQFFVTGFGKGLRIAAEYYFNKKVEDLDLVESAFIAGSVKGPDLYNPFTKKTEAEKQKAMRLAKLRKNYVLNNMLMMNLITEDEHARAIKREVPFREGKVTYRLNVILNYIRAQLESDYFRAILEEQGIENIATSGIKIYTSIDREIQEGTLNSLRKHLPLLDVKLSGFNVDRLQDRYIELAGSNLKRSETNLPFICRITHINKDRNNPSLIVSWDSGGGVIDYEGLISIGESWLKWKLGDWAVFDRRHILDFLNDFKVGDLVPVQFMETKGEDGKRRLVLSTIPELEGGIVVLREGMIKAMVGGFTNRFFNRAADAMRQLGSIFKPIVYTAALQLKWNTLDPLINMRDLFRFESTFYLPEPDHEPKSSKVSMTWAGVKSENLATVWLLYHLTDRLNMGEFRRVVQLLGLDRGENESYLEYVKRIRDGHGVVVNRRAIMEAAFEESKKEIESDLIFNGLEDSLDNLNRLHYDMDIKKLNLNEQNELQISRMNFQRIQALNFEMKRRFNNIRHLLDLSVQKRDSELKQSMSGDLRYFYLFENKDKRPRMIYSEAIHRIDHVQARPVTPEWILNRPEGIVPGKIWIDNIIPSEVVDLLQKHIKESYKRLLAYKRYDLDVLYRIKDFRTLANLHYVNMVAKEMGISTRLDPVLSFPLGANSISILEAALCYHTIMSGKVYPITYNITPDMVPIITKIVDREGENIWEYKTPPKKVLTRRVSGLITEILRLVMEKGTGQRAEDAIQLFMGAENERLNIPIPSFGKTGTANRFTNSSFVGFIPGSKKDSSDFDIGKGYVIGSYVGYDDNHPMKGRHVTIYGASGALPLWVDAANTIVNSQEYKENMQIADFAFDMQRLRTPHYGELLPVDISSTTGLPLRTKEGVIPENYLQAYSDVEMKEGTLTLKRAFEPLQGDYYEGKTGH